MLDDLQQRIAALVAGLDEAEAFVLAGGGALIVLGVVSKTTRDLDCSTTRPEEVLPWWAATLLPRSSASDGALPTGA